MISGHKVVYFNDSTRVEDCFFEDPIELVVNGRQCVNIQLFAENFDSFLSFYHSTVVSLHLNGRNVLDSHCKELLTQFIERLDSKPFSSLRTVEIIAGVFSAQALEKLCRILNPNKRRPDWTSFGVIDCRIEPNLLLRLIESLQANTNIREINIGGNNGGDTFIVPISDLLTKFENNITSLNLGNNRITNDGFSLLIRALHSVKSRISTLSLSNHRSITSLHFDAFFTMIMQTNCLVDLDLYGCSVQDCTWARYLPFIRSLRRLSLAHNFIDDANLICLCAGLTNNCSIVDIDLSHNRFYSYGAHALQGLFEVNRCLQTFAMRSNVLRDRSCWRTIGLGLANNPVLMTFDVCDCGLTLEDVEVLCGMVYQQNNSVAVKLHDNRLPVLLLNDDPRHYFIVKEEHESASSGSSSSKAQSLSPTAQVDSIQASQSWTQQTLLNIRNSLEAAGIVDEHGHLKMTSITSEEEFEMTLYTQDVVERSPFYLSPDHLEKMVLDMQQLHSSDKQTIQIAFGRANVLLGDIQVDVNCMYRELRHLVQPLVLKYMASVSEVERYTYLNYSILNSDGAETDGNGLLDVKSVWADVRHRVPVPYVVLRPASWIKLDDDEPNM